MEHSNVRLDFVSLLARHGPVAARLSSFLRFRDVMSLMFTCSCVNNVMRSYVAGLAKKFVAKIDPDFGRLQRVLKSTKSYIELDDRHDMCLFRGVGWRRQPTTRLVSCFVPGTDSQVRVVELTEYFVRELGYEVRRKDNECVSQIVYGKA
jgi:hypothetical protein